MEQFNKALSFILGLVVVAVFIVVASGKFNFKGLSLPKAKTAANITPTITPIASVKPTSKPFFSFFNKPTVKPTAKPANKPVARVTSVPFAYNYNKKITVQPKQQDPNYHTYSGSSTPKSIPNTGVPIVLFPLLGTSLITGIFMKKSGKKD